MKAIFKALLAGGTMAGASLGAALAETQFETVFQHKAWEVQVVAFDDGSFSCRAQVSEGAENFTVWAGADGLVKLQFYSGEWDFGEGESADLEVEIDSRTPWTMNDAELYLQSVLFILPDSDVGTKFLMEVVKGNTLYLRDSEGEDVRSYSLAGSSASIQSLVDCVDAISSGTPDTNPFK